MMKKNSISTLNKTHQLSVLNVIRETEDSVSIYFDLKGKRDFFQYKSGQHIILHFKINDQKISRAYSLFTAPFEDIFAITVKRVQNGLISNHINDCLKIGDTVEVSLPRGNFTINEDKIPKAYYFFGGGSGITPLLSNIKTILKTQSHSRIYFLYGNRNNASIIHNTILNKLQTEYPKRLYIEHELESEGSIFGKGFLSNLLQAKTGWIDKRRVLYFLKDNPTHLPSEYFICGPSAMMDKVEDALTEIEVDPNAIYIERFNANFQTDETLDDSQIFVQSAELTYTFDGIKKRIQVQGNKTLFESLTKVGEDIPHSCLSGSCASCACRLKKGKVNMKQCYALNETQLKDHFILTCQAIPQSKTVEIDFDFN